MNTKKQKKMFSFSLCSCFVRKRNTKMTVQRSESEILNAIAKGPEEFAEEMGLPKQLNSCNAIAKENSNIVVFQVFNDNGKLEVFTGIINEL